MDYRLGGYRSRGEDLKLIFADEALRTDPTVARWLAEVEKDESVEGIFLVEDITNYGAALSMAIAS